MKLNSNTLANVVIAIIGLSIFLLIIITQNDYDNNSDTISSQDITFINNVKFSNIKEIRIAKDYVIPSSSYQSLIYALKDHQGFQVKHDLGSLLGFLRITTNNGDIHRFELHAHPSGVVISFFDLMTIMLTKRTHILSIITMDI